MRDLTQGERGKTGDHGQAGEEGKQGPMGPAYSSWLTRNLLKAYLIPLILSIIAFAVMGVGFERVTNRIEKVARTNCVAGNDRSLIQRDDILDGMRQTDAVDLGKLFNIDEEQVAEFRRLSKETAERRLARIPFIDCHTGERLSSPP